MAFKWHSNPSFIIGYCHNVLLNAHSYQMDLLSVFLWVPLNNLHNGATALVQGSGITKPIKVARLSATTSSCCTRLICKHHPPFIFGILLYLTPNCFPSTVYDLLINIIYHLRIVWAAKLGKHMIWGFSKFSSVIISITSNILHPFYLSDAYPRATIYWISSYFIFLHLHWLSVLHINFSIYFTSKWQGFPLSLPLPRVMLTQFHSYDMRPKWMWHMDYSEPGIKALTSVQSIW